MTILKRYSPITAFLLGTAILSATCVAQSDQGAGQDLKDAGHSTAQATKKTGRKIKRGTKKAVPKSAGATEKGADKVENKTN